MDSPKLRTLTRTQLQSLAKRESIRANGKTEDIIRRLVRKHPKGVPVPQDPSTSLARIVSEKGTPAPPSLPNPSLDRKGKSKQVAEETSLSPTSLDALEQLFCSEEEPVAGSSNPDDAAASQTRICSPPTEPITLSRDNDPPPPSPAAREPDGTAGAAPPSPTTHVQQGEAEAETNAQGEPTAEADQDEEDDDTYDYGAPSRNSLIDTLRKTTTLVNAIPAIETHIAEFERLLRRAQRTLDRATGPARELAVTREYLETFCLAKFKEKSELWDGTGKMPKAARKVRMAWLRAERYAQAVKQWEEANKFNKENGFDPEPLEAFRSESDDEVIESLQTTPASSRCGSCKRTREADEESNDDNADEKDSRKRARS